MENINWKNLDEKYHNEVVSSTSIYKLKATENYNEAKKKGDSDAAKKVVESIIKDNKIYKELGSDKSAILIPVMEEKGEKANNQLPIALAKMLGELNGLKVNLSVYHKKAKKHTDATWADRILSPEPKWFGQIEKGRNYILVDDVFTSGSTLNSLKNWIENQGGKVKAVTTLSASRYGKKIGISKEQVDKLRKIDHNETQGRLEQLFKQHKYKGGFESMTYNEAYFLIESNKLREKAIVYLETLSKDLSKDKAEETKPLSINAWENKIEELKIQDWKDATAISIEKILENEKKLNEIFSQSAGKRKDLTLQSDGNVTSVRVPFFINKEAREVLKSHTEELGGKYDNIRYKDERGWKTEVLISFDKSAKLSPEVCVMIIKGAKTEEILGKIKEIVDAESNKKKKAETKTIKREEPVMPKEIDYSQQYQKFKEKYPDALLLIRNRDFYEAVQDDAIKVSEALGVTLTHQQLKNGETIKMAAFPFTALDNYLPKLVRWGYRVGVCDALETSPKEQKQEQQQSELPKQRQKKGKGI